MGKAKSSTKTTQGVDVEKLMAAANSATSTEVSAALAVLKAEQEKKRTEEIIATLAQIQHNTAVCVKNLRTFRKYEAEAKACLQKFADAEAQYMLDANYDKYRAAISK